MPSNPTRRIFVTDVIQGAGADANAILDEADAILARIGRDRLRDAERRGLAAEVQAGWKFANANELLVRLARHPLNDSERALLAADAASGNAAAGDGASLTGRALMIYRQNHGGRSPSEVAAVADGSDEVPRADGAVPVLTGRDLMIFRQRHGGRSPGQVAAADRCRRPYGR